MNKGHQATARARPWLFVDQAGALTAEVLEGLVNVLNRDGDVMNSRPALCQKL